MYYLGIDGGGRTGSYTLFVNRLTDEYGTTRLTDARVAVGGSVTGEIGRPRDRDWFAVELEAGRAYRIELEGAPTDRGTLSDPYLRGIRFNRELLPGTTDDDGGAGLNSRVDILAPETGTYFISVGAYSFRTGSYRLSVAEADDDYPAAVDTGAAVAVGGSATGTVDYGSDTDWFAVSLEAGRYYRVDLEGTSTGRGSLEDPVLRGIYDADGRPIGGTSALTTMTARLQTAPTMTAASRLTAAGTAAAPRLTPPARTAAAESRLTPSVGTTTAVKGTTAAWNSPSRKRAPGISPRAPTARTPGLTCCPSKRSSTITRPPPRPAPW